MQTNKSTQRIEAHSAKKKLVVGAFSMNCSLRSVNCHLSNMPHMCGLLPGPHTPGSRSLQLDEYRQAAWLAAHCTVWPRSNSEWNLLCWLPTIFSLAHKTIHTDMIRQDLQSLSSRLDRTLRYNNMFYFTIHIFENPTNRIDTAIHSFVSSFIHLKLVLDLRLSKYFFLSAYSILYYLNIWTTLHQSKEAGGSSGSL